MLGTLEHAAFIPAFLHSCIRAFQVEARSTVSSTRPSLSRSPFLSAALVTRESFTNMPFVLDKSSTFSVSSPAVSRHEVEKRGRGRG
jgi:hypothetical protein